MANSLPWSVKGVDPRTRDAAKAAARRAGMTLGEWLDHKIRVEGAADEPACPAEQLDIAALSERLARLSQGQMDTSSQPAFSAEPRTARPAASRDEIDAVLSQAASAERLTRESSVRTAGALDSIARWIEKTETRISAGERAAAERQERATNVIADAIKTMGERIVEIERKIRRGAARPGAGRRPLASPSAATGSPPPSPTSARASACSTATRRAAPPRCPRCPKAASPRCATI